MRATSTGTLSSQVLRRPRISPCRRLSTQHYRGGGDDVFITKFNDTATSMVFSTYLGGSRSDDGVRLTVDNDKNIYVTGYTSSLDFPLKNPPQLFFGGIGDLSRDHL